MNYRAWLAIMSGLAWSTLQQSLALTVIVAFESIQTDGNMGRTDSVTLQLSRRIGAGITAELRNN